VYVYPLAVLINVSLACFVAVAYIINKLVCGRPVTVRAVITISMDLVRVGRSLLQAAPARTKINVGHAWHWCLSGGPRSVSRCAVVSPRTAVAVQVQTLLVQTNEIN